MSTPLEPDPDLVGLLTLNVDYQELVNARPDYDRAELFYDGMIEEKYASPRVAQLLNRFGLNDFPSFNLAHIAVDALTDYLHLNSVTAENNALDNVLDDLRDSNDLDEEIPELLKGQASWGMPTCSCGLTRMRRATRSASAWNTRTPASPASSTAVRTPP